MHQTPSAVELREQLSSALLHGSLRAVISESTLKRRVCAVVDDCKAANCPSERVIVTIKQIAEDAGLIASRGIHTPDSANDEDAAIATIVQWSIEHYYDI